MPRCAIGPRSALLLRAAFAVVSCAALAQPAAAQLQRRFSAQALRGEIAVTQPPELLLNGKPARLSPGARVRSEQNLMVVNGQLAGQHRVVNYTLDPNGQLAEVWLLTADEAARKPWPTTPQQAATWRFDFAAQTWTRP